MATSEICNLLGSNKKKNYLVGPDIDISKENQLKKYNITYINDKEESFIKDLSTEIKHYFISDMQVEKLPLKKGVEITREKGFIPEFKTINGN